MGLEITTPGQGGIDLEGKNTTIGADGTAILKDTAGTQIDSVAVPPGTTKTLTAPDATVTAQNTAGESLGAATALSGGTATINVPNVTHTQTDGSEVELPAGVGLVCDTVGDTPISANGDLIVNQPSGVPIDIDVRYETLGTVATTIVGNDIIVPDSIPSPSPIITNSVSLDGTNDFLIGGVIPKHQEDWSVTMNVKMLNAARNNVFFAFMTDGTGRPAYLVGYYNSAQTISSSSWNSEWHLRQSSAITPDTNWHNLAVTYDYSATTLKVYWDSVEIYSDTSFLIGNRFDYMKIGYIADWPFVGGNYGNIRWTDFRTHDTVLTPAEVVTVDSGGLSTHETSRFPVTEAVGTTTGYIADIINGQRLDLTNMTAPYGVVLDAP